MKLYYKRGILSLLIIIIFTKISVAQSNTCTGATFILTDSACVNNASSFTGTLSGATADGGAIASTCTAINSEDVWYKFVAKTQFPTITVNGLGSSWGTRLKIQLLSGSCGSFTEVACANHAGATTTVTPALTTPLVPGTIYYIRIYKNAISLPSGANWGFTICVTDPLSRGSRMNEVFSRTILSPATILSYPWEVTYGPDNNLWITESRGYKVYKMDPNTGVKTTVLDISTGSTFLPFPSDSLNAVNMASWAAAWPQGGLAGLALHPKFLDPSGLYNFVYVSYIHRSLGGSSPNGIFFRNKLVRFTYNTGTGLLGSPAVLCDTLPGSGDHNSQRMIIAPVTVGGTQYLFYAGGDMGAGQFGNRDRPNRAQNPASYEGKILRFNLDTVGGVPWIPTTNPYSSTSAVYSIGMRNNQGFAYDSVLNILYGSSHGPYSDDEINIIQPFKNYGHPLVIGYADGNYNGNATAGTSTSYTAGAPFTDNSGNSSCPPVGNETTRMNAINAAAATTGAYRGPLFSAYPTPQSTIATNWSTNSPNGNWLSEAWSGLDLYQNKMIPGWNKSLVAAGLKWGRLIRLPLSATGTKTLPSNLDSLNTADTVTYFQSTNRYRDLAFAPNGKDIFLVMDNSSATSGPGVGNPTVPACPGCVLKYSFLGYAANASGFSTIPKTVAVTTGPVNTCNTGTPVTIDGTNNFLWVPITGPDGNIMAEINAMGQSLGVVNSSFYKNSGALRTNGGKRYLDRNITITPTVTSFVTPVKVRLYISKTEFDALAADPASLIGSILQLRVLKNSDPCSGAIGSTTTLLTPTNTLVPDLTQGANGYVLQVDVTGFSSFYFGSSNISLPLNLLTFTGTLQNSNTTLLKWKTTNEINTSHFFVERSTDGQAFDQIGRVNATGNSTTESNYNYNDNDVANLQAPNVFYRLKMYDNTGTYRYSNVIRVTMPGIPSDMTLSPNPASSDVKASITSSDACNADWQVIDYSGRILLQNTTSLKKGNNDVIINISQLPAGSYYLKVKGDCIDLKNKFQKL
ncbi:MAG: PQQ-dependent sugar dehydrogenase [Ferruginibacter sp.]